MGYEEARHDFVTVESIGKSHEGEEMLLLKVGAFFTVHYSSAASVRLSPR
jgi:hypothetical protein